MLNSLTSQDLLILVCLIVLVLIVGIICIILTLKNGNKKKENKSVLEKSEPDINMALATSNIPEISEEAPLLDELLNENIIDGPNQEQIQKIEEEQDMKNRSSIEEVLRKMNEDLEKQKYQEIDRYEEEQEENAVISYQDLVERKLALAKEEAEKEVSEVINKTTYLEEDEDLVPVSFEKTEILETPSKIEKTTTKFSNSDFISPVFGRLENTMEYPTLKKVVETSSYTEEKVKPSALPDEADEFLNTLKEFRKNL